MANYHYDNRKSYNNQPLKPGQAMIPVYVDWDMVRYYQMDPENLETWRIRGHNEYSCAMKSHFRKFGNQMSGSGNHLCNYASLLA